MVTIVTTEIIVPKVITLCHGTFCNIKETCQHYNSMLDNKKKPNSFIKEFDSDTCILGNLNTKYNIINESNQTGENNEQ